MVECQSLQALKSPLVANKLSFDKFLLLFGDEHQNNKNAIWKAYKVGYGEVYGFNKDKKPKLVKFEAEVFGKLRPALGGSFHSKERWKNDVNNVRDGNAGIKTYQHLLYGLYVNIDETLLGRKFASGLDAVFKHLFKQTFEQRCDTIKHILETSEASKARLTASARGRTYSLNDLSVKIGLEEKESDPSSADFMNLYLRLILEPFGGVADYIFGFSELLVLVRNESEGAFSLKFNKSDWDQDELKWGNADIEFSGLNEDNAQIKLHKPREIIFGEEEFLNHLFTIHSFDSANNYPPDVSVTLFGNASEATLRRKGDSTERPWVSVTPDLREKFLKRVTLKHRLHRHIDEPWLELANQTVTVSVEDLKGLF